LFKFVTPLVNGETARTLYLGEINTLPGGHRTGVTGADLSPDEKFLVLETYKKMHELSLPTGTVQFELELPWRMAGTDLYSY
jgi:hypothetical protein